MKNKNIYVFALAALGDGISGGDRIFIELTRRWSKKINIKVIVWEEGLAMCKRQKLKGKYLKFITLKVGKLKNFGFIFTYFYRTFLGIKYAVELDIKKQKKTYIYSASEFIMDTIPAFILKVRYPKITWVAAWYQTAPNPISGFSEGSLATRYRLKALMYWLAQLPTKPLIKNKADLILVNNEDERKRFSQLNNEGKVAVIIGAVDLSKINIYIKKHNKNKSKKYDAVFQGRFHPQKGVVELIKIWNEVVKDRPRAKLAMIGDGPLMEEVKEKINTLKLSKNVKLFGYVYDGDKKYNIFSNSKIVVHPAYYDSGGMASAEAMAFGLPAVGFDLVAYKSYYPKGMLKVKKGDEKAFSRAIAKLLKDQKLQIKIGSEAKTMIEKSWSWDVRADEILSKFI